jgi:glycosyltransferase involved in cell wall biosynthesis
MPIDKPRENVTLPQCAYPSKSPLICTLIPTYRRPQLLERAIRSVLNQTYSHLQVCVFDNASGDETRETVLRLAATDPRVRYFCHAENIGGYLNFVYAMDHVETPFFSILSDDDMLLPRFYETAMQGFSDYPEAMMSATTTLIVDEAGTVVAAPLLAWEPGLYRAPEGFLAMLDKRHPDWASIIFRREVVDEVGGLDLETGPPSDLDFELRVASRFPMVVSTEFGAIFVIHSASFSSGRRLNEVLTGWLKMIRNQTTDVRVPAYARDRARIVLTGRLKATLFAAHGLGAIARRQWDDNRQAAHILHTEYDQWSQAAILTYLGWACEHLPLMHAAFLRASAVRRSLMKMRLKLEQRNLQKKFASLPAYLDGGNAPVSKA